jgi:hypothetical protein
MPEFSYYLFHRIGVALLGGIVVGLALLVQIILRDALGDGLPLSKRRVSLVLRMIAAITAFTITVLVLRFVFGQEGKTVVGALTVFAGLLISVLLGRQVTRPLAARIRARFLSKSGFGPEK